LGDVVWCGVDGYINDRGTINTKRLQVVLDEMALWEQEVFEKEYADVNWYKGKQAKHVKEMEMGRKRTKLGSSFSFLLFFTI
jgi:5'-3' exoribonuclease 1